MAFDAAAAAAEILRARDALQPIKSFSSRGGGFEMVAAYRVSHALNDLRLARGERPVGRKIGFTNRNIWPEYGVYAPIWGEVYDTTVTDVAQGSSLKVSHLSQPRIEPEIVLGLDQDLQPGMALEAIEASIGWVAHGFEIVQTVFPDWKFTGADCMAEGGLHGALAIGPRRALAAPERKGLAAALADLHVSLARNGKVVDTGVGANALDGPIHALKHLVDTLADLPSAQPLCKGEVVTTGTLTRAFPVVPGEIWSTMVRGYDLPGLEVKLV